MNIVESAELGGKHEVPWIGACSHRDNGRENSFVHTSYSEKPYVSSQLFQ